MASAVENNRASKKSLKALVQHIENIHRQPVPDADRMLEMYWRAISSKPSKGRNPDDIRRLFTLYETIRTRPLADAELWSLEKTRSKDALHTYLSIYRAIDVNRRIRQN